MSEIIAQAVTGATNRVLATNAAATAPTRRALEDDQRPKWAARTAPRTAPDPARISDSGPVSSSSRGAANTEGDCSGGYSTFSSDGRTSERHGFKKSTHGMKAEVASHR